MLQVKHMATQDSKSAAKVLAVLDVLLRNFAHGFSPSELVQATGFSGSDITRYVQTLEQAGYAERIPETNRIRPSHKLAQKAIQIIHSLDQAHAKISESKTRLQLKQGVQAGEVFNFLFSGDK
jgi:DNA-binding IclR family transcriptional regulator